MKPGKIQRPGAESAPGKEPKRKLGKGTGRETETGTGTGLGTETGTGTRTEDRSDLEKLKTLFRAETVADIAQWCGPYHRPLIALCVLQALYALITLGIPVVTRYLVDSAVGRNSMLLLRYGLLLAAVIVLARLILLLYARIFVKTSAELRMRLRQMVTDALLQKDYASLRKFHSGELVNRIFSDADMVRKGVTEVLPDLCRIIVSFLGAAVILIMMDWHFLPLLLLCACFGLLMNLVFRGPVKRRYRNMQAAEDALHASTQETLEHIRVIKASGSESRVLERSERFAAALREKQMLNDRLTQAMRNGMGSLFDLSWLLAYLWGCVKIFRGDFTYGSLAALIPLIGRIQGPVANAAGLLGQVYSTTASAERLQELLCLPEDRDAGCLQSFERIRFTNVSFRYDDGISDVLTDVNVTIERGDCIALTGESGGGKTSLFQLLLGIYPPTKGAVLFEEGEAAVPASRGTRRLFAYVPQGNTLFSGTLRENLMMFSDHVSEEDMMAAVRIACLEELVAEIGLDAMLGEHGIGLSEGQAQRVAIARALLSDAPILLLDESTSALDASTEARLLQNIAACRLEECSPKTVMIVTHRPAALSICSRHWHLEHGRVREL